MYIAPFFHPTLILGIVTIVIMIMIASTKPISTFKLPYFKPLGAVGQQFEVAGMTMIAIKCPCKESNVSMYSLYAVLLTTLVLSSCLPCTYPRDCTLLSFSAQGYITSFLTNNKNKPGDLCTLSKHSHPSIVVWRGGKRPSCYGVNLVCVFRGHGNGR